MKNKSGAFSLIELSIVILIIGVLIAGVTQASRLVRQSKLTTAKTLSQSSPVNSIAGLMVWLEPTMDSSFKSSEAVDGAAITTWYDLSPQSTIPNAFTASSGITYKATGSTNALPTVAFADNNTAFAGTLLDAPFSAYTIFYVAKSTNLTAANTIFHNGVSGTNGFGARLSTGGLTTLSYGASSSVVGTSAASANQATADIICITIAPNSVLGASVETPAALSYRNGVDDMNGTVTTANWVSPTTNMFIGNSSSSSTTNEFIGEISEIIIFDSVLKKSDRQEIEKYLSKKYAITITQN
jgi:prepilin-type N-terminal cleavage/methylation domain-containing protein